MSNRDTRQITNAVSILNNIINGDMRVTETVALTFGDGADSPIHKLIARHAFGDWGDVDEGVTQRNEQTIQQASGGLLSIYKDVPDQTGNLHAVWIVTNNPFLPAETATTVLLPSDL